MNDIRHLFVYLGAIMAMGLVATWVCMAEEQATLRACIAAKNSAAECTKLVGR